MSSTIVESENPLQFMKNSVNKQVRIVLKWNMHYEGELCEFDNYFNIVLNNASEFIDDQYIGQIGKIAIRCNNVKMIQKIQSNKYGQI